MSTAITGENSSLGIARMGQNIIHLTKQSTHARAHAHTHTHTYENTAQTQLMVVNTWLDENQETIRPFTPTKATI